MQRSTASGSRAAIGRGPPSEDEDESTGVTWRYITSRACYDAALIVGHLG